MTTTACQLMDKNAFDVFILNDILVFGDLLQATYFAQMQDSQSSDRSVLSDTSKQNLSAFSFASDYDHGPRFVNIRYSHFLISKSVFVKKLP